jgi:LysR family transcriptional regulator, glycine cleavage system transcriptional activator
MDEPPDPPIGALPPLAWLKTFEVAVSAGGIRSAGRQLGLHHSVVSRQISQLEAWVGVALREPDSHRFVLTVQGSKYFTRIATPLAEIAGATHELMAHVAKSAVRIWCSPGLSVQWLAGQISEFRRAYPDYIIELRPSERPANLKAYEADANLYLHLNGVAADPPEPSVSAFAVGQPVSLIAASPELIKRLPPLRSARDLLACPLLHTGNRDMWKVWFAMHGVGLEGEAPGELCWDSHLALEAARLGRGLLWANPLFLERSFARGELVDVRIPGVAPLPVGTYVLTCREDRWDSPVMKCLRHFLRERMKASEQLT